LIWQAASVLPRANWVLETLSRKLTRGLWKLVRLPGIAPGHAPWRGAILAVKSQPRKLKGPGAFLLPAHAISIKNKHLLLACATNPRFHGGCFGV